MLSKNLDLGSGYLASPLYWRAAQALKLSIRASKNRKNVGMEGVRLDWPPDFTAPNRQYLLSQLKHKYPIVMV